MGNIEAGLRDIPSTEIVGQRESEMVKMQMKWLNHLQKHVDYFLPVGSEEASRLRWKIDTPMENYKKSLVNMEEELSKENVKAAEIEDAFYRSTKCLSDLQTAITSIETLADILEEKEKGLLLKFDLVQYQISDSEIIKNEDEKAKVHAELKIEYSEISDELESLKKRRIELYYALESRKKQMGATSLLVLRETENLTNSSNSDAVDYLLHCSPRRLYFPKPTEYNITCTLEIRNCIDSVVFVESQTTNPRFEVKPKTFALQPHGESVIHIRWMKSLNFSPKDHLVLSYARTSKPTRKIIEDGSSVYKDPILSHKTTIPFVFDHPPTDCQPRFIVKMLTENDVLIEENSEDTKETNSRNQKIIEEVEGEEEVEDEEESFFQRLERQVRQSNTRIEEMESRQKETMSRPNTIEETHDVDVIEEMALVKVFNIAKHRPNHPSYWEVHNTSKEKDEGTVCILKMIRSKGNQYIFSIQRVFGKWKTENHENTNLIRIDAKSLVDAKLLKVSNAVMGKILRMVILSKNVSNRIPWSTKNIHAEKRLERDDSDFDDIRELKWPLKGGLRGGKLEKVAISRDFDGFSVELEFKDWEQHLLFYELIKNITQLQKTDFKDGYDEKDPLRNNRIKIHGIHEPVTSYAIFGGKKEYKSKFTEREIRDLFYNIPCHKWELRHYEDWTRHIFVQHGDKELIFTLYELLKKLKLLESFRTYFSEFGTSKLWNVFPGDIEQNAFERIVGNSQDGELPDFLRLPSIRQCFIREIRFLRENPIFSINFFSVLKKELDIIKKIFKKYRVMRNLERQVIKWRGKYTYLWDLDSCLTKLLSIICREEWLFEMKHNFVIDGIKGDWMDEDALKEHDLRLSGMNAASGGDLSIVAGAFNELRLRREEASILMKIKNLEKEVWEIKLKSDGDKETIDKYNRMLVNVLVQTPNLEDEEYGVVASKLKDKVKTIEERVLDAKLRISEIEHEIRKQEDALNGVKEMISNKDQFMLMKGFQEMEIVNAEKRKIFDFFMKNVMSDGLIRIPIKLVLSRLKGSSSGQVQNIVLKYMGKSRGHVHNTIIIGGVELNWFSNSRVFLWDIAEHPKLYDPLVVLDCGSVDFIGRKNLGHFFRRFAKMIVDHNVNYHYQLTLVGSSVNGLTDEAFCNRIMNFLGCYTRFPRFVQLYLDYLGRLTGRQLADMEKSHIQFFDCEKFKERCTPTQYERWCRQRKKRFSPSNGNIFFENHADLDDFVIDLERIFPNFRILFYDIYCFLKSIDRCFWMEIWREGHDLSGTSDDVIKRNRPSDDGCPFGKFDCRVFDKESTPMLEREIPKTESRLMHAKYAFDKFLEYVDRHKNLDSSEEGVAKDFKFNGQVRHTSEKLVKACKRRSQELELFNERFQKTIYDTMVNLEEYKTGIFKNTPSVLIDVTGMEKSLQEMSVEAKKKCSVAKLPFDNTIKILESVLQPINFRQLDSVVLKEMNVLVFLHRPIIELKKDIRLFLGCLKRAGKSRESTEVFKSLVTALVETREELEVQKRTELKKIEMKIGEMQLVRTELNHLITQKDILSGKNIDGNVILIRQFFDAVFMGKHDEVIHSCNLAVRSVESSILGISALEKSNDDAWNSEMRYFDKMMDDIEILRKVWVSKFFQEEIDNVIKSVSQIKMNVEVFLLDQKKKMAKMRNQLENVIKAINETRFRQSTVVDVMKKRVESTIGILKYIDEIVKIERMMRKNDRKKLMMTVAKIKGLESQLELLDAEDKMNEKYSFEFALFDDYEIDEEIEENQEMEEERKKIMKKLEVLRNRENAERLEMNLKQRKKEKLARVIYMLQDQCLDFMKTAMKKVKGGDFEDFLKRKGVFVERSLSDYSKVQLLQRNLASIFLGYLNGDFFDEPKIIKVMDCSPRMEILIQNEIEVLMKLSGHPAIIPVNNVFKFKDGETGTNKIGFEMDYYKTDLFRWLKGHTFKSSSELEFGDFEKLKELETVPEKKSIFSVFKRLLDGIQFIHSRGIQHRDLKPENVLLNNLFEVKIIDFGIARDSRLTITSSNLAATLRYLSPEKRLEMDDPSKKRTYSSEDEAHQMYEARDMYAFGLMLLESLVPSRVKYDDILGILKNVPFEGDNEPWIQGFGIQSVEEISLLKVLLNPDPKKRISAQQVLKSRLFALYEESGISLLNPELVEENVREKNVSRVRTTLFELFYNHSKYYVRGAFDVKVDRQYVEEEKKRRVIINDFLLQTMEQCQYVNELLKPLKTTFVGEKADDSGGVTRELFSTLFEQFIDLYCDKIGMNKVQGLVYHLPTDRQDHSEVFFQFGKLMLKCLLEKRNFRISFGPLFYAFLLDQEPTKKEDWIKYCNFYDVLFIKNLERYLNDRKIFQSLIDDETTFIDYDDGMEKKLTESNRREYILNSILEKMNGEYGNRMKNLKSFKKGFYALLPEEVSLEIRNYLNPVEFEVLCFGDFKIPIDVLMKNIKFPEKTENIQEYFKRYFGGSEEKRRDFFRYCCGSCDLSDGNLMKDGSKQKVFLRIVEKKNCVMAHTCGYVLEIWEGYAGEDKYDIFVKKWDFMLENFRLQVMEE